MNKIRADLIRKGIIKPAPKQEPSLEKAPVKAVRLLDDRPVPKQRRRS